MVNTLEAMGRKAKWQLYLIHGTGPYRNYLTNKQGVITADDIKDCLKSEEIRASARNYISKLKQRIKELEAWDVDVNP